MKNLLIASFLALFLSGCAATASTPPAGEKTAHTCCCSKKEKSHDCTCGCHSGDAKVKICKPVH